MKTLGIAPSLVALRAAPWRPSYTGRAYPACVLWRKGTGQGVRVGLPPVAVSDPACVGLRRSREFGSIAARNP